MGCISRTKSTVPEEIKVDDFCADPGRTTRVAANKKAIRATDELLPIICSKRKTEDIRLCARNTYKIEPPNLTAENDSSDEGGHAGQRFAMSKDFQTTGCEQALSAPCLNFRKNHR
jgi:hypothetical protein